MCYTNFDNLQQLIKNMCSFNEITSDVAEKPLHAIQKYHCVIHNTTTKSVPVWKSRYFNSLLMLKKFLLHSIIYVHCIYTIHVL